MSSEQKRAVDSAIDHIVENIRVGRYAGGQRLVEIDLIEETGIGRGPMREALRVLAGDGVVEIVPNRGARVRKLEAVDLVSTLEVLSAINLIAVGKCALLTKNKGARQQIRQLWKVCKKEAAGKDEPNWYIAIGAYHEALTQLCGNRVLHDTYLRLRHVHFHRELADSLKVRNWDGYVGAYDRITESILRGDREQARLHTLHHADRLVELLTSGDKPAYF